MSWFPISESCQDRTEFPESGKQQISPQGGSDRQESLLLDSLQSSSVWKINSSKMIPTVRLFCRKVFSLHLKTAIQQICALVTPPRSYCTVLISHSSMIRFHDVCPLILSGSFVWVAPKSIWLILQCSIKAVFVVSLRNCNSSNPQYAKICTII